MADDLSTNTDVADTSNDSEDVGLEDIEVNLSDIDADTNLTEEELPTGDEPEEEEEDATTDETDEEESEESEDKTDDTEEEAEPELSEAEQRKAHNAEMAQRRIAEKQAREEQVKQAQADYIAEASENRDPLELAVRQLQVTEYNNTVERVSNTLTNQYERAVNEFPVLSTKDPVIQAEIDAAIDAFQAQHVTIDQYGNPVDVRGDLYATLQNKADAIEKLTGIRASRQESSKAKEKSKAITTPSRAPKEPKVDPMLAAFDEEVNSWK